MKIPEPKQLPSGTWFVRVYSGGVSTSISDEDYYVCKAKAMALKTGIIQDKKQKRYPPLIEAIDNYIAMRENVLSPSTICGYRSIQRTRFKSLMPLSISEITKEAAQRACNLEAKICGAKTLSNAWRFISAVIYETSDVRLTVRLPQLIAKPRPFLDPEQIKVFTKLIEGKSIEIPALLALSSLRISEIRALTWNDIDLNQKVIHVRGATVYGGDGVFVHKKETKNRSSRRSVPMLPQLYNALITIEKREGYIVTTLGTTIYKSINRLCAKNDLPKVGNHGLRHSFASLAYHLGMPEKVAMEIGGWANDQTMHRIYTHVSRKSRALAENAMLKYYDDLQ